VNETKSTDRVQNLLTALQRVNEDMLSLGDDLLLSIRPPDKESIETGYQALKEYNACLEGSTAWFQSYKRLVGSEHVASLFPSVPEPGLRGRSVGTTTGQSKEGHQLGEDFRYTRPRAFELEGYVKTDVATWRELYLTCSKALIDRHPDFLDRVSNCGSLKERGGKSYFSSDPDAMRDPLLVTNTIYAEGNLSANGIKDVIGHLLNVFGISKAAIHIYLQDRGGED
jgi:hypothetical protein